MRIYLTRISFCGVQYNPMELKGKANQKSRSAVAFDQNHQPVRVNDTVTISDNIKNTSRQATVRHIHKSILWVHSDLWRKDSGISVVRSMNCVVAGEKPRLESNIAAPPSAGHYKPADSNKHDSISAQPGAGGPKPFKKFGKDEAIGKTLKIIKGAFKGYLAHVIDVTDTHYSVELHSKLKKIMIEKNKTKIVGDHLGSTTERMPDNVDLPATPFGAPMTPSDGLSTPGNYNETPRSLGTPGRDDGDPFRVSEKDVKAYLSQGGATEPSWGDDNDWGNSGSGDAGSARESADTASEGAGWGGGGEGWCNGMGWGAGEDPSSNASTVGASGGEGAGWTEEPQGWGAVDNSWSTPAPAGNSSKQNRYDSGISGNGRDSYNPREKGGSGGRAIPREGGGVVDGSAGWGWEEANTNTYDQPSGFGASRSNNSGGKASYSDWEEGLLVCFTSIKRAGQLAVLASSPSPVSASPHNYL